MNDIHFFYSSSFFWPHAAYSPSSAFLFRLFLVRRWRLPAVRTRQRLHLPLWSLIVVQVVALWGLHRHSLLCHCHLKTPCGQAQEVVRVCVRACVLHDWREFVFPWVFRRVCVDPSSAFAYTQKRWKFLFTAGNSTNLFNLFLFNFRSYLCWRVGICDLKEIFSYGTCRVFDIQISLSWYTFSISSGKEQNESFKVNR